MIRRTLSSFAPVMVLAIASLAHPSICRAGIVTINASRAAACPTLEELSEIDHEQLQNGNSTLTSEAESLHILVAHGECEVLQAGQQFVLIHKGPEFSLIAKHPPQPDLKVEPLFVRSIDIWKTGPKTVHPARPPIHTNQLIN